MGSPVVRLKHVIPNTPDGHPLVSYPITHKVQSGEVLLLTGPNGVGKTTLLNIIAGVHPYFTGSVQLDLGCAFRRESSKRMRHVSYLFQRNPAPDKLFVGEYLRLAGVSLAEVPLRGALAQLRNKRRRIGELSMGQRQFLAAMAVLRRDALLYLLDEPLRHLSDESTEIVMSEITRRAKNAPIILVEHEEGAVRRSVAMGTIGLPVLKLGGR